MTTKDIGDIGEKAAAKLLKKSGYKIKERNIHLSHNEIDIVAEDKQFVVFVEVKTRTKAMDGDSLYGVPSSAVDSRKRERLIRAAIDYMKLKPTNKQPRMDVIEVWLDGAHKVVQTNHIENAYGTKGY